MTKNHLLYWMFKAGMVDPHDYQFDLVNAPDWVVLAFEAALDEFERAEAQSIDNPLNSRL